MVAPFSLIIFGATGDLTRRKLISALFTLFSEKFFPSDFLIVGFSRREINSAEFTQLLFESLPQKLKSKAVLWRKFVKKLIYCQGNFEDLSAYERLWRTIADYEKQSTKLINTMHYLATPPQYYEAIIDNLYKAQLGRKRHEEGWTRLLIEKPFGKDLENAQLLDKKLDILFKEEQIYRIDHYLGKETVQNIIAFRFANGIFDPVWNRDYIDHVQITLSENSGVGSRGSLYDGLGALRDVSQNHIMQLVAMTAMEQPLSFSAEGVRNARYKAISQIRPIADEKIASTIVRGQYTKGYINRSEVSGYTGEKNVAQDSKTETYVAMKLFVDAPRFVGVPFYVRSGKRLQGDVVEISLCFKQVCHILFKEIGCPEEGNILTIRVQPREGISTRFIAKVPGHTMKLAAIDMDFSYAGEFSKFAVVDAYERVLQDAFYGDQMLFNRSDELLSSWGFIAGIMAGWKKGRAPLYTYKAGTWGPAEAEKLIQRDGRKWIIR